MKRIITLATMLLVMTMMVGTVNAKDHGKKGHKGGKHHKMKSKGLVSNLMPVIKHHGKELNLTSEQKDKLKSWAEENHEKVKDLMKQNKEEKKALREAALAGEAESKIMAMIDSIQARQKQIVSIKLKCYAHVKSTLNEEQFNKVIEMAKKGHAKKKHCENCKSGKKHKGGKGGKG